MSNVNETLIKELGVFLTIASENKRYHTNDVPVGHPNIFGRSLWHIMMIREIRIVLPFMMCHSVPNT